MQIHEVKYASLCAHDFHKSLTNEIELQCKDKPSRTHRISQMGKICNKCTHIIKDSHKVYSHCLVCSQELEQFVKDRELCQHQHRQFFDIIIKCINNPKKTHQIPFKTKVCKRCNDKLRAAFMNSKLCKVCEGLEEEVIRDMEKTYISSAYSYFKQAISALATANAPEQTFQNEIQSACKSEPRVKRKQNTLVDKKLLEEYENADLSENHQSKRYKLYAKCRKHKDKQIHVCNNCLVALLNIDSCPFGCVQEQKVEKNTKDKQVKVSQTGFLSLYPLTIEEKSYLELFVIKLIEERGRMDRWDARIQRISPKSDLENKFKQKFPLFYSAVAVSKRQILVSGGMIGPHVTKMRPTNQSFVVSLSEDLKQYSIIEIKPMNKARSGHTLVFLPSKSMVFSIGGFDSENKCFSKQTEVYSILSKEWYSLNDLNVERSKPTAFVYQQKVYAMGGVTNQIQIEESMAQTFNFQSQQWETVSYGAFDYPHITNCASSSSIPLLRDRSTLLLFGGSQAQKSQQMTKLIQPVKFSTDNKEFNIDYSSNMHSMKSSRINTALGLIKEDTILCFGGAEQFHDLLDIEGFTLKLDSKSKQMTIFCELDAISVGSYRLILREDSKVTYRRLYEQLEKIGLIDDSKMSKSTDKYVAEGQNHHLIEKLWYTFGKLFIWVPT